MARKKSGPRPGTKKANWCYRKATPHTYFGSTTPRVEIVDETSGVKWTYIQQAWDERIIKSDSKYKCWDWDGSWHRQGIGIFNVHRFNDTGKSGQMSIQRFSMAIKLNRPIKDTEKVKSECKNPACCNPHHLRLERSSIAAYEGKYAVEWLQEHKDFILANTPKGISEKYNLTYNQAVYLKHLTKVKTLVT